MRELMVDVLRLVAWLTFLAAIFVPLERLFAQRPARIWRAQTGVDLGWYFINSLLPAMILSLPIALVARLTSGFGFHGWVQALPLWLKLLLAIIVNDFGAYWAHRWQHRSPFLWRFHAVHHSAEHIDWLVNTRGHPADMVLTRMAGLLPLYVLGLASPGADPLVAWVMIAGTIWAFLIHANVRWRLGPLEWLISTPAFHHWHHTNCEHRDRNFAALFPMIDRVFGTLHLPGQFPTIYGIDGHVAPTLSGQLLDPLFEPVGPKAEAAEQGLG